MPDGSPYCHRRALNIADVDKYNFCRASHAEANAIAQAARHGVPIKGATLYVTLEPCYVCVKLLATAQIEAVFFELPYESRDDLRDTYWKEAVAEAGFKEYRQLTVSPEALQTILPSLREPTSTRRLPATRGTAERTFIGAVEPD
jgi:dCMP deaminase